MSMVCDTTVTAIRQDHEPPVQTPVSVAGAINPSPGQGEPLVLVASWFFSCFQLPFSSYVRIVTSNLLQIHIYKHQSASAYIVIAL